MNTRSKSAKQEPANAKPVIKLRIGVVTANAWAHTSEKGTFYSVNFERGYRDDSGNWRSSKSFNQDDLLTLAKLADGMHTEILKLRAANR